MSLILDALKRAERERRGESAAPPPPMPVHVVGAPRAAGAGPRFAGIAVIVGGLALAGLLLWDAFRTPAPPAPPAAAPAQPAAPAAQAPIVARPAPAPAPAPAPTVVPGTEDVASLDDLTDEATLETEPGAAPPKPMPKPVPARPAPAPKKVLPQPDPDTIQTTPTAPTRAAEMKPAQPAAAQPEPAPAPPRQQEAPPPATTAPPAASAPAEPAPAQVPPVLTQPAPLRKFREMPPDYRADFPALRVDVHVYEKDQQRRFVMVNGKRYREGERLAEGPALVEIVPEGMVLEHRGEKVLYTLGR